MQLGFSNAKFQQKPVVQRFKMKTNVIFIGFISDLWYQSLNCTHPKWMKNSLLGLESSFKTVSKKQGLVSKYVQNKRILLFHIRQ